MESEGRCDGGRGTNGGGRGAEPVRRRDPRRVRASVRGPALERGSGRGRQLCGAARAGRAPARVHGGGGDGRGDGNRFRHGLDHSGGLSGRPQLRAGRRGARAPADTGVALRCAGGERAGGGAGGARYGARRGAAARGDGTGPGRPLLAADLRAGRGGAAPVRTDRLAAGRRTRARRGRTRGAARPPPSAAGRGGGAAGNNPSRARIRMRMRMRIQRGRALRPTARRPAGRTPPARTRYAPGGGCSSGIRRPHGPRCRRRPRMRRERC